MVRSSRADGSEKFELSSGTTYIITPKRNNLNKSTLCLSKSGFTLLLTFTKRSDKTHAESLPEGPAIYRDGIQWVPTQSSRAATHFAEVEDALEDLEWELERLASLSDNEEESTTSASSLWNQLPPPILIPKLVLTMLIP